MELLGTSRWNPLVNGKKNAQWGSCELSFLTYFYLFTYLVVSDGMGML